MAAFRAPRKIGLPSAKDWQRTFHRDFLEADSALIGQHLDAGPAGPVECRSVDRVHVPGGGKRLRVAAMDEVDHHSAMAGGDHVAQFLEVLDATRGDAVRELRQSARPGEMDILYFDISVGATG